MIEIRPAHFVDMCWVTANLRAQDKEECFCQLPEDATSLHLAHVQYETSILGRYCATVNGQPVCVFGVGPFTEGVGLAWAFGTNDMTRAVPAVSRFIRDELIPDLRAAGYNRVEARSLSTHVTAHRWLEGLGARFVCDLKAWGRDGQEFKLFEWLR